MNDELVTKWIAALRSGEYKQTQGILHHPKQDAYCCLGVLCKVAGAEFKETDSIVCGDVTIATSKPFLGGKMIADDEYSEILSDDFYDSVVGWVNDVDQSTLTQMNDDERNPKSFAEIADFIEENIKK